MAGKVTAIAVCGVFSPVNPAQEQQVEQWIKDELPNVAVSLSYNIGSLGLLERENATILNAALQGTAKRFVEGFCLALEKYGIHAEPYFSQNDGTLMSQATTLKYPILTIACGPTNSIRGASYLTQLNDAIVIDVGGTTSDIGVLANGYPRESGIAVELGEVRTNFRMPDILALAIGGGSIVSDLNADSPSIGPQSVGYQLTEKAQSFGGNTLTLTDVALSLNVMQWQSDPKSEAITLSQQEAASIYALMVEKIEEGIDKMKTTASPVPAILVGGGSALMPDQFVGISEVIRPQHFEVANAIGVALSEVSGVVDKIVSLPAFKRTSILLDLETQAKNIAIDNGADPQQVNIIEKTEIPLSYLKGNMVHVKIKAAGLLL